MKGQRLRRGMQIKFAGQRYSVAERLTDGELQLRHLATETLLAKPEAKILKALFEGVAELLGTNGGVENLQGRRQWSGVNDFEALEETDPRKREALRRSNYVQAMRKARLTDFGKNAEKLKPIIERVCKAIHDPSKPSCMTAYRWQKDYTASGDDIRVLAPAYKARGKARGHDKRRISSDGHACNVVDKIIDDVTREHYLQLTRPKAQCTYDLIVARISNENRFRNADDQLPTPHRSTLYRKISKLDPYEKDKARYGKRIADLRHKVNKQGVRPTRPLERVEIDDTTVDLFVIDENTKLPIGRPRLMIAICAYTKMMLGYYLSFVKPSYLSVMQTLLHSIRPKTYVKERYPEIVHSWDAYGLPELVVVDNAKQYYSASFDEACLQLGIITQYAPVKHPYYKPSIERMFGTLNTQLLHQMPGTTFSNIAQKWDYDPKKNASISIQRLDRIIHNWICDVYQHYRHRGIDDVPARRWEIGTRDFPPALPYNVEELNVLLGHIEHRSISSSGIEMWGLYYNDACLSPLKSRAKKGERVKIKYDPMDISVIHVYDEISNIYLTVPAADQAYTQGLSLWQHKVIKREARLHVDDYVDMEQLCLAKARIQKMVDEQFTAHSKSSSNVKAALWQGTQGKPTGRLEISGDAGATGAIDQTRFTPTLLSDPTSNKVDMNGRPAVQSTKRPAVKEPPSRKTSAAKTNTAAASPDTNSACDESDRQRGAFVDFPKETELDYSEFASDYNLPRRK